MIHLAYLCEDRGIAFDGIKGSSVHLRSMVRAFADSGARVSVLSPRLEAGGATPSPEIRFVKLEPDSGGRLAAAAALEALHARSPIDAVYERLSLCSESGSLWCAERGVAHWLEVNAPLAEEAAAHRGLTEPDEARAAQRRVLRHADLILPVSPWLERWLLDQGVAEQSIRVLPNGIDRSWLDSPRPRRERSDSASGEALRIGFVGSLRPWHDLDTALEALAMFREGEARLELIGDGPGRDLILQRLAKPDLAGRAIWRGGAPHHEVAAWIDAMDVCLAPYPPLEDFYFCPVKIFEYGARRRPVLAPRIGALAEQFPRGSYMEYRAGDAADLARRLRAFAREPQSGLQCAARLFDYVAEHTWEAHARAVLRWGGLDAVAARGEAGRA